MSDDAPYDRIAGIYDPWSRSVTEDVDFYVEEAMGPVHHLSGGQLGRVARSVDAFGGVVVVDQRARRRIAEHLAREYAEREAVGALVDLRVGDLREPPVTERVPLVAIPFRSLLHMADEEQKLRALSAAAGLLEPDGRLVFDVFAPSEQDIEETDGLWLEREPGIFERADWDARERTLTLTVRSHEHAATMELHWLSAPEWHHLVEQAGLEVVDLYGWFDRRPYDGGEDQIWVCRRSR